jgi:1,4-dihydroxy-2-naphthoate octaprenyltransferase
MKRALIVTVVICLVWRCCAPPGSVGDFIGFLVLGGLSIVAAITYTVGTRPYGYIGLGDISVLVFFGWLSVLGSWYLQAIMWKRPFFCRRPPAVCWRPRC